jgi:hypothetical protein
MKKQILITFTSLALATMAWTGCHKITGGGKLVITGGGITDSNGTVAEFAGNDVTIAFNGQPGEDTEDDFIGAKGQIQVVDHTAGIIFHGVINETINSQYQQYGPYEIGYWGSEGKIKVGKNKFIAVDSFQFNVYAPPGDSPTVFLALSVGDITFTWNGTLDLGNFTVHTE